MNAALQGLGAGISLLAIAPWLYCQERARLTEYGIVHVVVAADSQHFAAATNRHRVIVWRTQDFKLERTFQHEKRIIQLAFSGDSKSLVLATRDFGTEPTDPCQVEWYDIAGDKMTKTKVVPGFVHTLGRDRFAALTVPPQRDRVTIHNLDTGENHKIELGADYEKIAFSPNGSLLATLDQGRGLVRLWDTKSGKLRTILDPGSQTYEFVFPADSKRLFTYRGANLWSWDLETGKCQFKTLTRISHFLPGGDTTMWADEGDWVFYSTRTGLDKELARFKYRTGRWQVDKLLITPDQRLIIGACNDGQIRIWDVPKLKE